MNSDETKQLFASFVSAVTVVTCVDRKGRLTGLTASAVTPVSLRPPQLLVCVGSEADVLSDLRGCGGFNVHVLEQGQDELAWAFALGGEAKQERLAAMAPAWSAGANGLPVLEQCLARMDCSLAREYPGGDHNILLGKVASGFAAAKGAEPMVYYQGRLDGRLLEPPA